VQNVDLRMEDMTDPTETVNIIDNEIECESNEQIFPQPEPTFDKKIIRNLSQDSIASTTESLKSRKYFAEQLS